MSGKFMRVKRIVIPMITMVLISSQLMGCAAVSESELLQMLKQGQEITIEVAVPESIEQGEEVTIEWTQLDQLTSQPELRKSLDSTFKIINVDNTKNGILYVNTDGSQDGNNTLLNVFSNSMFRSNYWNNESIQKELATAAESVYADIEVESDNYDRAMLTAINAYFNILNDSEPGYANLDSTISRIEAMAAIFKAESPVVDNLALDNDFNDAIGAEHSDQTAIFASNLSEQSYLTVDTGSLNSHTAKGAITRGELAYLLVQQYFADEYKSADPSTSCFADVTNGGDIATQQKFIENDTNKTGWQSYELVYALQNIESGCPERMYKALVVAHDKGIIATSDCRWDEAVTKADFLEMLTNTYEALPVQISAERGEISGYEAPTDEPTADTVEDTANKEDINANDTQTFTEEELIENDPINQEPIVEEPVVEDPVVEEPIVEEPTDDNEFAKNLLDSDKDFLRAMGLSEEQINKITQAEFERLVNKYLEDKYGTNPGMGGGGSSDSGNTGDNSGGGSSSNNDNSGVGKDCNGNDLDESLIPELPDDEDILPGNM